MGIADFRIGLLSAVRLYMQVANRMAGQLSPRGGTGSYFISSVDVLGLFGKKPKTQLVCVEPARHVTPFANSYQTKNLSKPSNWNLRGAQMDLRPSGTCVNSAQGD